MRLVTKRKKVTNQLTKVAASTASNRHRVAAQVRRGDRTQRDHAAENRSHFSAAYALRLLDVLERTEQVWTFLHALLWSPSNLGGLRFLEQARP